MRYNCKYITGAPIASGDSGEPECSRSARRFGKRGIDGMLNTIRYPRENHLGMQTMVIEFAQHRGLEQAD